MNISTDVFYIPRYMNPENFMQIDQKPFELRSFNQQGFFKKS